MILIFDFDFDIFCHITIFLHVTSIERAWLFTKAHGTSFAQLYTFYTYHVLLKKIFALVNFFQSPPQTKTPVKTTFRDWCFHGYSY